MILALLILISVPLFSQNAFPVGEVQGFKVTALAGEETILSRTDSMVFNYVLSDQKTGYLTGYLNKWLELDGKYNRGLIAVQRYLGTLYSRNSSITFVFKAYNDKTSLTISFEDFIPYRKWHFYLKKDEIETLIDLLEKAEQVSAEKIAAGNF